MEAAADSERTAAPCHHFINSGWPQISLPRSADSLSSLDGLFRTTVLRVIFHWDYCDVEITLLGVCFLLVGVLLNS